MYPHRVPPIIHRMFPHLLWLQPSVKKELYLTFDDGPIPEITPWILDTLKTYNAKATFFCVGENASKHPQLLNEILNQGHRVGNHGYHHLNGWNTNLTTYLQDMMKCEGVLDSAEVPTWPKLYRPPYGKILPSQIKAIKAMGYRIVMWHVLTGDFDPLLDEEQCLQKSISLTKEGSVIVFHDNIKAKKNLYHVLPKFLAYFSAQGYQFKPIC